jgi:hypothetical protein
VGIGAYFHRSKNDDELLQVKVLVSFGCSAARVYSTQRTLVH